MENIKVQQNSKQVTKNKVTKVAVAYGDGIGPEIMEATLRILNAAGANIQPEKIEVGEQVYLSGNSVGIEKSAWEIIYKNKIT